MKRQIYKLSEINNWMLERYFNKTYLDAVRDYTSFGNPSILFIIALLLIGFNWTFIMIVIGWIAVEIGGSLIKLFDFKNRPKKERYSNMPEKIDAGSFPSLHVARVSFVFISIILLINEPLIKVILGVLIPVVAFTRIKLKKHYLVDTIAGFVLGAIFAYIWGVYLI